MSREGAASGECGGGRYEPSPRVADDAIGAPHHHSSADWTFQIFHSRWSRLSTQQSPALRQERVSFCEKNFSHVLSRNHCTIIGSQLTASVFEEKRY